MTRYRLSITQTILQTVSFILLFIENMFVSIKSSNYFAVGYYKEYIHTKSFFEASISDSASSFAVIFGYVFIALALIYTILLVINLFKKIPFINSKTAMIFPIIIIVIFAFFGFWIDHFAVHGDWDFQYNIEPLYIVQLVLLAGILVVDLYRNFSNLPYTKIKEPKTTNTYLNDLNDLKNLLDNGVITQEEFDQKKKQLLGL